MKKIIFVVMLALAMVPVTFGQFTTNTSSTGVGESRYWYWAGTIDSVDTMYSNVFSLSEFDAVSFYDYPINYAKLWESTIGMPFVKVFIQGTYDRSNYTVVDTLAIDSLETFARGNLNINDYKFPYYRLMIEGYTAGDGDKNKSDTAFKIWLYAYHRKR